MNERLERAEEEIAHLRRAVDDLSEVITRQAGEIDLLTRRVRLLMERAAETRGRGGGDDPARRSEAAALVRPCPRRPRRAG